LAVLEGRLSLLAAAREHPTRIALVAGDGTHHTYADLAERVRRAMAWLDHHVEVGAVVAFVPRLEVSSLVLLYALVERETTALLLHPRLTERERRKLVDEAKPSLVIEEPATITHEGNARSRPVNNEDTTALAILYTSGTTGSPKGARLSRRSFLASAAASERNLGWNDEDRWLLTMPLAHVGGLSIVIRCLIARKCVVLPEAGRFDAESLVPWMTRHEVTIASLVPTMLRRVFEHNPPRPPPSLRAALLGGAAPSSPLLDEARVRGWPVLTTYGLTEACSQVTTQRYGTTPSATEGSGHPLAGVEIQIRDHDRRILLRGKTLMSGYHGRAAIEDGAWFETEDFGHIDEEGRLHVLGRSQDLIVTGGENVYPLEVERALESIAGVEAAGVFAEPDETWGDLVCAALVLRTDANHEAIQAAIATELAAHKRPRRIVVVPALPHTEAGKLDRAALARIDLKTGALFP